MSGIKIIPALAGWKWGGSYIQINLKKTTPRATNAGPNHERDAVKHPGWLKRGASACSEAGRNAADLLSLYKHDGICLARDCWGRWHTNASTHSFTHMHAPGAFVHFNESTRQKQEGKQRCHFWLKRLFFAVHAQTRMRICICIFISGGRGGHHRPWRVICSTGVP